MLFHEYINSLRLEVELETFFPVEDFSSLCLPQTTYPMLSQGLPRYLNPSLPDYLRVKKGFDDKAILKKRILDKPLLSLFNKSKIKEGKNIVLLTYVVPGGLGDLFCHQELRKILERELNHQIYSFIFIHKNYENRISEESNQFITFFDEKVNTHPKFFTERMRKILKKTDLILEIPTLFSYKAELLALLKPGCMLETIGEYGFIQSDQFLPTSKTRCLGLHFLETGIFIPNVRPQPLMHLSIYEALLKTKMAPVFYFAYLVTDYGCAFYLTLLLELNRNRDIHLITLDIGLYLKLIENELIRFKSYGVKQIEIYYKEMMTTLAVNHEGLTLKIFHTGPLSHEDFLILATHSQEPLGVRGNLSLSEGIELEKGFFYDLLDHNLPIFYELLSITKDLFSLAHELLRLYKKNKSPFDSAVTAADLIRKGALKELKKASVYIKKHFKADDHLVNLVNKTFFSTENPSFLEKEQQLVALFQEEKITFKECIVGLKSAIDD